MKERGAKDYGSTSPQPRIRIKQQLKPFKIEDLQNNYNSTILPKKIKPKPGSQLSNVYSSFDERNNNNSLRKTFSNIRRKPTKEQATEYTLRTE